MIYHCMSLYVNHDNMESKNNWQTYMTLVSCNMEHVENYVITGPKLYVPAIYIERPRMSELTN